jgi:D-alanine-D-alanine ligase
MGPGSSRIIIMAKRLRVGILFGGRSAEHEVSLVSARNIMAAADPKKYEVVPIGITKQGQWRVGERALGLLGSGENNSDWSKQQQAVLENGREVMLASNPSARSPLIPVKATAADSGIAKFDVIFPVLHGTFGEDGTVQGLLELAGIPYVGAGVLGSAAGMDKVVMKRLFHERGLPIVPYLTVRRADFESSPRKIIQAVEKLFRYPVFVKPANLGSSVGISKARNRKELLKALETAAEYDRKILVERAVNAREIECAVLGNDAPISSIPGEVAPAGEFYDYAAKYIEDTARLIVPAPLRKAQVKEAQRLAVAAFQAVDCAGMGRVDLFLEKRTGKFFVNEINTIPGFTSISMYPRLWEATGIPYAKLLDRLIALALERHHEKTRTKYSLEK